VIGEEIGGVQVQYQTFLHGEFDAWVKKRVPELFAQYPEVPAYYSALIVKTQRKSAGGLAQQRASGNGSKPYGVIQVSEHSIRENPDDARDIFSHEWAHIVSYAHKERGHRSPVFLRVCEELGCDPSPTSAKPTVRTFEERLEKRKRPWHKYTCKHCGWVFWYRRRYKHHKKVIEQGMHLWVCKGCGKSDSWAHEMLHPVIKERKGA